MRFKPVSGLILSKLGTIGFQLQVQPPAATPLASATTASSGADRKRDRHQRLRQLGQALAHEARRGQRAHVEVQRAPQHLRQRVAQRRREQRQRAPPAADRDEVAEVARAGDLAFLARLLQSALRGWQVAVLCVLGRPWVLHRARFAGPAIVSGGRRNLSPKRGGLGGQFAAAVARPFDAERGPLRAGAPDERQRRSAARGSVVATARRRRRPSPSAA